MAVFVAGGFKWRKSDLSTKKPIGPSKKEQLSGTEEKGDKRS